MAAASDPQIYVHVRIVMGMILGLCVTRLLNGFAKFIQHPHENQVSPLHLGWAASTLLSAILFWWWEYRLSQVSHWTFLIYFFVLSYASMFYFMAALLFPDHLGEYPSYRSYFYAKRKWFFGILAFSHVMDIVDSFLKNIDYFQFFKGFDEIEAAVHVTGCLIAMSTRNPHYHAAFLLFTLLDQMFWIGWLLNSIN